jgi:cytochrome c2
MLSLRWWQVACLVVALGGQVHAQSDANPFVAGFERFARHQEIDEVVAGRLLLTELSCTACHATKLDDLKPKLGPRLDGAGNRLGHEWMARFLAAPQKEKPGTTMPDVLASFPDAGRGAVARALAAFLSSQREPFPEIKGTGARGVPLEFWKHGDAEQGRRLYHQVGCVACHEADDDYETVETKPSPLDQLLEQLDEDELKDLGLAAATRRVPSVPHGDLAAKYSPQSLTHFLIDPHKTRTGGRMPNLKLGVVEAADIAAWLLKDSKSEVVPDKQGQTFEEDVIQTGRRLFGELGCSNCHSVKDVAPAKMAKPLAELDMTAPRSCVGALQAGLPHFQLDSFQIAALKSALTENRGNAADPPNSPPNRRLDSQMLKLNCLACHERDGKGGVGRYRRPYFETVGHVDIGDEGRLPPPLTAVGQKLQSVWLARVLKGMGDVRPHMRIRMPVFPADQVRSLPAWLAQADQESRKPASEKDVFGDVSKLAEDGRLLLDTGCVQCHPLRGDALPGVVGTDLEGIAARVQPLWFHDFLLNPGQLKPRTRMPTFFPNGKSQNAAILKGDTEKQIAAMWAYLKNADKLELPPKIQKARSQDYELIPKDRPIVLRTFMDEAGTHAIAVGFPEKVHFAFDAEHVRLAAAWRGRFLDAQGTWFVRFAPAADPLGEELISLPPGVPFVLLKESLRDDNELSEPDFDAKKAGYRFLGYRLDESGVPTFLYRYGRFDIEDRIKPDTEKVLIRRLTISDRTPNEPPDSLWFRGHFGKSLKYDGPLSYTNDGGVSMTVSGSLKHEGELAAREDGTHWIVPVKVERQETIEVRYRW